MDHGLLLICASQDRPQERSEDNLLVAAMGHECPPNAPETRVMIITHINI